MAEGWQHNLDYVYHGYGPLLKKYGIETKEELEIELTRMADEQNVDLNKAARTMDKLVTAVMTLIIHRKNDPTALPDVSKAHEYEPDDVTKKTEPAKKAPKE